MGAYLQTTETVGPTFPSAVLWDMDGTLVDSEKLWDVALRDAAESYGGCLSECARSKMVGNNAAVTVELLLTEVGVTFTQQAAHEAEERINARMAELLSRGLSWREGAAEALRLVRDAGTPCALVTSTPRMLTELALDHMGRDNFDVTVCGDEVAGLNKPHPEPYRRAAGLLGVEPTQCVAVEDSPSGVAAAEAAGAMVLVVAEEIPVPTGEFRTQVGSLLHADLELFARTGCSV